MISFRVQVEETLLEITVYQDVRATQDSPQGFYKVEVQFPSANFVIFFSIKVFFKSYPAAGFYAKT